MCPLSGGLRELEINQSFVDRKEIGVENFSDNRFIGGRKVFCCGLEFEWFLGRTGGAVLNFKKIFCVRI